MLVKNILLYSYFEILWDEMAGCINIFFYFHFFKAFGIDVIIFYFKILKKKKNLQPLWVSNLARFFLHLRDRKCIANKSQKDLTKISINILSGFSSSQTNTHTHHGRKHFSKPQSYPYISWRAEHMPQMRKTFHCHIPHNTVCKMFTVYIQPTTTWNGQGN